MTSEAEARRVKSAITGLLGFAAAEEQVLLTASPAGQAGDPGHWAPVPLVAHNTEFKAQQVQRLLAIAEGRVPEEFGEVDHASGELYRRYAAEAPDRVAGDSVRVTGELMSGLRSAGAEDLFDPSRNPWLKGRQLWLQIVVRGFWHPTGHLLDYYLGHGQPERAVAMAGHGLATARYLGVPDEACGMASYNLACAEARAGQVDDALAAVREAVSLNPGLRSKVRTEPDLAALRDAGLLHDGGLSGPLPGPRWQDDGMPADAAPAYAKFARFYDEIMGDRATDIMRVRTCITRYQPTARTLLELGSGTGAVLAGLARSDLGLAVTGVDRSAEMLAVAASKVPAARLVQADMTEFAFDTRFDVVICVFDTLNHLARFESWRRMFTRVHEHLADGGLFFFDVNTIGRLRGLWRGPAFASDFGENAMIMDVWPAATNYRGVGELSTWTVRIFERVEGEMFRLHAEHIPELAVPLAAIREALAPNFEVLEASGLSGEPATDESARAFFACRRRSANLPPLPQPEQA